MKSILRPVMRLLVALGSLVLVVVMTRSVYSLWRKKDIVRQRQLVVDQLKEKNQQLKERLMEASSSSFVERQAREKLGLVREGETVVLIRPITQSDQSDQSKTEENVPNWKKWWGLFF